MTTAQVHVCHVVLSLNPGGLENGVINVINGLPKGSYQSSVICLQQSGEFASRIADPSVPVIVMGLQPGNDPAMPFRVARVLRSLRPDIVHTRNIEAFFYGAVAAKIARIPHIIHSEHGRTFPETALRAFAQRTLLRFTDYAFAVSQRLRRDLSTYIGVSMAKFAVLYNGVDLARFAAKRIEDQISDLGQAVQIASVGRLASVKNYPLLLRGLAELPESLQWRCQLVGDGPEREMLQALALELGLGSRIEFLGHRDDVDAIIRSIDIFVLPSISEGLSNTLLEAMAAGAAVIASDAGGNPEIVIDEVSGMLFPSGNLQALVEKLSRLVSDAGLRRRLGDAAMRRVQTDFDLLGMLRHYAAMYSRVAGKASSP